MQHPYETRAYQFEYRPKAVTADLPAGTDPVTVSLRRWALARRRGAASAAGIAEAVSRYQRALAAGDGDAMARQAGAAKEFAVERLAEARVQAVAELELMRALLPELLRVAKAASTPADAAAAAILKTWRHTAKMPVFVELWRELAGGGTAEAIASQPEELDRFLKRLEARVLAADLVRSALETTSSHGQSWPEPPNLSSLLAIERRCKLLVAATAARRIELAPAAGESIGGGWWAIRDGVPLRFAKAAMRKDLSSGPLAPGMYSVYLCQRPDAGDQAPPTAVVRLATSVPVDAGGVQVRLTTGLRVVPAEGLPVPHQWFVIVSGARTVEAVAARTESLEPVWLLPGKYDVYWIQNDDHRESPLVVASGVEVAAGRITDVPVSAATVRLSVADTVPKPDGRYGGYAVVMAGDEPDRVVQAALDKDIVVPPGVYDVYWRHDYDHLSRPLLIATRRVARANAADTLTLDSGVELRVASWVPARDPSYGWWGIVPLRTAPDQPVHWTKEGVRLAAPPGVYDVYWVQDYNRRSRPLLIAVAVVVTGNNWTTVTADSGVHLEVAPWVPARDPSYGWWGVVAAGDLPDARINWSESAEALLAPPGRYDVYWVQGYDQTSTPLLIAADVEVLAGASTKVSVATGLALDVSPRAGAAAIDARYGWWGVVRTGEEFSRKIHWTKVATEPLVVPPGMYDVIWKRDYDSPVAMLRSKLEVSSTGGTQQPIRVQVDLH